MFKMDFVLPCEVSSGVCKGCVHPSAWRGALLRGCCAASSSGLSKCSCSQGFGTENTAGERGAGQRDPEKKEGDEYSRSDVKGL